MTLGAAQYRAGETQAAIASLGKSLSINDGKNEAYGTFFLAMANWQLGNQNEAREYYKRAVVWMDANNERHSWDLSEIRAEAEELTFPLASDPDKAVLEAWGAWGEKSLYGKTVTGVIRSTVVVDPEGTVELAQYNVKATGHVAKLRRDLGID